MTDLLDLSGQRLEVVRHGSGDPLLYLHGEDGTRPAQALVERLSGRYTVIVPSHPGWGQSERAPHVRSLDDIAYVYLDLLDQLGEGPLPVVGASIGAWLALEIATKSQAQLSALALIAPIGVKLRGREERDFLDLYATAPDDVLAALYGSAADAPDLSGLGDEEFLELAKAQEAVARYAWEPYMHNPSLRHRLHRVTVPTAIIAGDNDGFVLAPGYHEALAAEIPGAETIVIAGGAHRVEEQRPADVSDAVAGFVDAAVRAGV
jgi:pimeloyl-ACP methyl ester carboxylesterase